MATSASARNGRDSNPQYLGVKAYDGQLLKAGSIIVRQRGTKFLPGTNVSRSSDDSLFARVSGIVTFEWVRRGKQQISVYPKVAEKPAPAKKAAAPKAAAKPAPKAEKKAPAKKAAAKPAAQKADK